jgi:hypothetical protein
MCVGVGLLDVTMGRPVVTLWQDEFERREGRLVYNWPGSDPDTPDTRLGFRELMDTLAWADAHCGGRFKVITAIAKDTAATPRPRQLGQPPYPESFIRKLSFLLQ